MMTNSSRNVTVGYLSTGLMARRLKQTLVRPMDRNRCTNQIFDWPDHIPNYFSLGPSLLCTEIDEDNVSEVWLANLLITDM